ncbi:MAG: pentapeptide repeat-containing protein, partial [Pseudomonadota bacterium]
MIGAIGSVGALPAGLLHRYACLYKADLTQADLRGAMLMGTDLRNANLAGAKLQAADYN